MKLRVCALYPDLMNIYADRGNLLMLERRCAWRGIGFELHECSLGDPLDDAHDLYYIGGAPCDVAGASRDRGALNGGLLMGVMLTERPDLFGAIHCGSPLLDMRRYSKLLAGASWMDEYGDPDKPEDWAYIQKYSPYQNIRPGKVFPPSSSPLRRAMTASTPAMREKWPSA